SQSKHGEERHVTKSAPVQMVSHPACAPEQFVYVLLAQFCPSSQVGQVPSCAHAVMVNCPHAGTVLVVEEEVVVDVLLVVVVGGPPFIAGVQRSFARSPLSVRVPNWSVTCRSGGDGASHFIL